MRHINQRKPDLAAEPGTEEREHQLAVMKLRSSRFTRPSDQRRWTPTPLFGKGDLDE